MAMEKWVRQLNTKLDRIAEALGIDTTDVNWNSRVGPVQTVVPGEQTAPWEGYEEATVNDVLARLDSLDDVQRERLLSYERAHRNRSGIVTPLVNWNS